MILRGPLSPNMSQGGEGVTETPIVSKGSIWKLFEITPVHALDPVPSGFQLEYYFIHQKYIQIDAPG